MGSVNTRERLIVVADELLQRKGFHRTTLARVAETARVHLGTIYYFFKTKRALVEAVIDTRLEQHGRKLEDWEELPDPRARLLAFVGTVAAARGDLSQTGCPIGTLAQELRKDDGPLADRSTKHLRRLLTWIERQFRELGYGESKAKVEALHLLSALQGVSTLAQAFRSPSLVRKEAQRVARSISAAGGGRARVPDLRAGAAGDRCRVHSST